LVEKSKNGDLSKPTHKRASVCASEGL